MTGEPNVVTLTQAITDLGEQVNLRLDGMVTRMDRIDRAVVGEEVLGHVGLVTRVGELEQARRQGDEKLHARVDAIVQSVDELGDRWDRAKWVGVGAMFGAGLTGGGLGALLMQGILNATS